MRLTHAHLSPQELQRQQRLRELEQQAAAGPTAAEAAAMRAAEVEGRADKEMPRGTCLDVDGRPGVYGGFNAGSNR